MTLARTLPTLLLSMLLAGSVAAEESGNFVVRLGVDTTAAEHYTRAGDHLEIDQVGRAPRVLQRHYTYDFDSKGNTKRATLTVTIPGSAPGAPPMQQLMANFAGDSMSYESHHDTTVTRMRMGVPAGATVLTGSSPWSIYEAQIMRLVASKADSLRTPLYFLGADEVWWLSVRKLGRDSVIIENGHDDLYRAQIDGAGHILHVVPLRGTQKFTVDRVETLDLPAMTASYAARERQGTGIGMLSPRDTVRVANAGGATLWIDYGRPAKRGRIVFGGVVAYGQVWRTGANAATQFRTDKPLVMGGVTVPAGFYTLWTIPAPGGWKLKINSETGQWGTDHKADRDLYTIDMTESTLPQPVERLLISVVPSAQGGVIQFDWDTTRASVTFTTQP